MKFLHLSDLHLGKKLHEFDLSQDQEYILKQILKIADEEKVDSVLIAGDIFDRTIAPVDSLKIFDDFLLSLTNRNLNVFIIAGNHDSAERLSFGNGLFKKCSVHISDAYNGTVEKISLTDEFGEVNFYLLPFIRPSSVKSFFPDEKIESYTDAVNAAIKKADINFNKRNIILSHQFITGAKKSDSEELNVGGLDNVDASVYDGFDYAALGHIHRVQKIIKETIRYCGTPLKYSFSEAEQTKSVTVVELKNKGDISIKEVPLEPYRDLHNLRGTFEELTFKPNYENLCRSDLFHITLTDENEILDAFSKLKVIYPNLLLMDYDNARTKNLHELESIESVKETAPAKLFADFFENRNNLPLNEKQKTFIEQLTEEIWRKN